MKIMLAGSSGGHLAQLYSLKSWWETEQRIWVTFPTDDARSRLNNEKVVWASHSPDRNLLDNLRSARLAISTLLRFQPDLIVTAGASLGTFFVLAGKILKIPTIYVEVFDRIELPSLSGRICYRIADGFAVQWEKQLELYPKATVIGPLL